jgi:aminoacrylate hydrolase
MPKLHLADGGFLDYRVDGKGPPLVLVTGLNGLAAFWDPHVEALGEHFTLVRHDHRGAGASSLDPIAFSVEQMAADVVALMDHLGLARAHLLGHSTGGAIGQVVAIDHPLRLDRLVLSATWPGRDPYFDLLFHARARVLEELGPEEYVRETVLIGRPPQWLRDHPEDTLPPAPEAVARLVASIDCTLARIAAIRAFDRRADLHRIRAPTLVAGAADDMVTPVHLSYELATLIPGARRDIADWGGHFYPVIRPDVFRHQVLGFLLQRDT